MPSAVYPFLYRIEWSGTLGTDEIFDHGMWITCEDTNAEQIMADRWSLWPSDLFATVSTGGFGTCAAQWSGDVNYLECSAREYSLVTHKPLRPIPQVASAVGATGTGGQTLPYQDSLVITLFNGRPRGRKKYNRTFLPPFDTAVLTTSGKVFTSVLVDFGTFMNNFLAFAEGASPASSICYYGAADHDILAVESLFSDDILDTQERRTNHISGTRTTTVIT